MTTHPGADEHLPMDARDVTLGLVVAGMRVALASGRLMLAPARAAARLPGIRGPVYGTAVVLASDGSHVRERARLVVEALGVELLAAPELERAIDRALAGPLTDAVARSISQHRVAERVAAQILADLDFDRLVDAVLNDERTEIALERALASPALERLVVRVLESRLVDDLTERVLDSPELQMVIERVASSPEVLEAMSHHTETLAEEMVSDVRRRSQRVDDVAERTVRSWLRRPRSSES
jgi:hypothetical protein